MTINTGQLEIKILQKLNASSNTSDIQALVNAKEFLKTSDIIVVTNYSNLPAASSVPAGSLYFVEADELTYIPAQDFFGSIAWRPLYDMDYSVIWSWGTQTCGSLGNGTSSTPQSSPLSIVGGFTDWKQVSSGRAHTVALKEDGRLWSWGLNSQGRLGDGTTVHKFSPVSVIGGFTDWCQVSAGCLHTAAVRTNGTLWTWGSAACGTLGDGTTVSKSSPVSVVGGFVDWCQVSAGTGHTVAVRQNGTLWSWGQGACGKLGINAITNRSSPESVVGGFTDWCQVSASGQHTIALRSNGSIWSWGFGCSGVLGTNSTVSRSSPVSIVGGFTDWCQVAAGYLHNAAVRTNGTLWLWGYNTTGQLGDGTTVNKSSPVSVIGGFTDWCQVSAGSSHITALRTNGTLWAWGFNQCGTLGDNTTINKSSPISVLGGFTDWCQVSAGRYHNSAIRRKVF